MIDTLSLKIATYIKSKNEEETPSIDIMRYFTKFLLLNGSTIFLVTITSMMLGNTSEVFLALGGLAVIRFFAGGFHIRNAIACVLATTAVVHIVAYFSSYLDTYDIATHLGNVCTLILIAVFAPSQIEKQTKFKKENYIFLKWASLTIVITNIIFIDNNVLAATFFIEALTLINKRKGGKEK